MIAATLALLFAVLLINGATAFPPLAHMAKVDRNRIVPKTSTRLQYWFPNEGMEKARTDFPLWFFGAAGSGGVARQAIPKLWNEYQEVQKLKGVGPTLGGPTIGLSPLAGYPEDISIQDLVQIVNNPLSIEQIVQKYPVEDNMFSKKGYLTFPAYQQANEKYNPLAVRAVFDSFQRKAVNPVEAQECIDEYRTDLTRFKKNLASSNLVVIAALLTLLFLLGLADLATSTDFYYGWFPDWPGGVDFPSKLLTPEGSPFAIPDYWMPDAIN